MTEQELFKKVHSQVLDCADDELISRCANWGYEISQTLLKSGHYLEQVRTEWAEQSSPFMYAVTTAVMIGEFAKRAFNDHFDEDTAIDLDLLDMDFEQVRGFIDEGVTPERLKLLKDTNSVGLQDIWGAVSEWMQDTHRVLVAIYHEQGEQDPNVCIFNSLLNLYKETDEGEAFYRGMTDAQKMDAYGFVSGGFRY